MKYACNGFLRGLCCAALLITAGLGFFSCASDSGGESRQVRLNLADSLKNYAKVKITLMDAADTTRIIAVILEGKLDDPKSVAPFPVPDSVGDFIIRVQGFDEAGLLALQSTVTVTGGAAGASRQLPPEKLPALIAKVPSARLAALDVSQGTLVPAFDPAVNTYALQVPYQAKSLSINAVAADTLAALAMAGSALVSGATSPLVELKVGENAIQVEVTPPGGLIANKYVITVTRLSGAESRLDSLGVKGGELVPAFNPGVLEYADTLPEDLSETQVFAFAKDAEARVVIGIDTVTDGVGRALQDLVPGVEYPTKVAVTSPDGLHMTTYTILIIRRISADAALASLSVSGGAVLIPDFDPDFFQYKAVVALDKVSIIPAARAQGASITVDGIGVEDGGPSQTINLSVGLTPIIIGVTSPDGKVKKSYTLTLQRSSPNALLNSLQLDGHVPFDSAFQKFRLQYKAVVPRTTTGIGLAFEVADVNAKVAATVNGIAVETVNKGATPPNDAVQIDLKVGLNVVKLEVTAPDNVSKTNYLIAILRQPANVAELTSLGILPGLLSPAFSPAAFTYEDTVLNSATNVSVKAVPKDSNAMVIFRLKRPTTLVLKKTGSVGLPAPKPRLYITIETDTLKPGQISQKLPLEVGENLVEVEVVAEDGTTRQTYSTRVKRMPSSNARLSDLLVTATGSATPFTLTPATFSPTTFKYVDTTFATYVTVTPTAFEATARISVNGSLVASGQPSGSITLANGINEIKIDILAPDALTKAQYLIVLDKRIIIKLPPKTL